MHIKQRSGATTIKEGNFVLYLFMALSAKLWLFTRVNRRMEMIKNHCVRKVSSIDKRIFSSLTFIFVKKKFQFMKSSPNTRTPSSPMLHDPWIRQLLQTGLESVYQFVLLVCSPNGNCAKQ